MAETRRLAKFLVHLEAKQPAEKPVDAYVWAWHQIDAGDVALSMLRDELGTTDCGIHNRYRIGSVRRSE